MSKVLITGGAGFIGSRIAQNCVKQGLDVRVFDLVKSKNPDVKESIVGSILDPYEISQAMRGCDYVVHAAAALGVRRTENKRLECLYINIQGSVNVLDAAVKERIKKVLFTSSSEVFGDVNKTELTEESPLNPKSNYAITKLVGEEYLQAYKQSYGLEYSIVRFFSVYGEGQADQFVVPKFINAVSQNKSPLLYGEGKQLRAFCYVDDAARGATLALLSEKANGQVYNIGNAQESLTIEDLATKIIKLSGTNIKAEYVPYEDTDRKAGRDIYFRIPCVEKAKKDLGFEAQVNLTDGLSRMLDFASSSLPV